MPLLTRHLDAAENLLETQLIEIIETSTTSPSKQNHPCIPVLNKKIPRVKFEEHIIIIGKLFDGKEIAGNCRDMKNIFKA